MNRRQFTVAATSAVATGVALEGQAQAQGEARSILELRYLRMRTGSTDQMQRASEFLSKAALPALKSAGAGPFGFFASVIAPESPFILVLTTFPSLAAMETIRDKEAHNAEYRRAREAYNAQPGLGYERLDSSLLRCFPSMPHPEPPPREGKEGGRIFELRMYESDNATTLARKIEMFGAGEMAIFQRLGMHPVFFGETIVGAKMPNLVYMLTFDSLAARESAWKNFGSDPEWRKLRSRPGYSDSEIVSNISNAILRPLPFSEIR